MRKYGYWCRTCRTCSRLWTSDTEAVLEREIAGQIDVLGNKTSQHKASRNLLRYGKDAVPFLFETIARTRAEKRMWAAYTLSRCSPELVVDSVNTVASNPGGRRSLNDILATVRSCYAMTGLGNYVYLKQICDAIMKEFS